jgi:hypothetical protein
MGLADAFKRTAVYFGFADDGEGADAEEATSEALALRLEAMERRIADNTAAVEALRAEIMRLSAKL